MGRRTQIKTLILVLIGCAVLVPLTANWRPVSKTEEKVLWTIDGHSPYVPLAELKELYGPPVDEAEGYASFKTPTGPLYRSELLPEEKTIVLTGSILQHRSGATVRSGMTLKQVEAALGKPERTFRAKGVSWRYGGGAEVSATRRDIVENVSVKVPLR